MSPKFASVREAIALGQIVQAEALLLDEVMPATASERYEAEHLRFLVDFYSGRHKSAAKLVSDIAKRETDDPLARFHAEFIGACQDLIADFESALRRIGALVTLVDAIPETADSMWRARLRVWHGVAKAFTGSYAGGYKLAMTGVRELEELVQTANEPSRRTDLERLLLEAYAFAHTTAVIHGRLQEASHLFSRFLDLHARQPFHFFYIHILSASLRQAFRERNLVAFAALDRLLEDAHTQHGAEIDRRYTLSLSSLLAVMNYESNLPELGHSYWSKAEQIAKGIGYRVGGAHFMQADAAIAALFRDFPRALELAAVARQELERIGPRSQQTKEALYLELTIRAAEILNGDLTLKSKTRRLAALARELHSLETAAKDAIYLYGQVKALRLLVEGQESDLPTAEALLCQVKGELESLRMTRGDGLLGALWLKECDRLAQVVLPKADVRPSAAPNDSRPLHAFDSFARRLAGADVESLPSAFAAIRGFFKEHLDVKRVSLVTWCPSDALLCVIEGDQPLAFKGFPPGEDDQRAACKVAPGDTELYYWTRVPYGDEMAALVLEGGRANPCFNQHLLSLTHLSASVLALLLRGRTVEKTLREQSMLVAIGKTTQMLAHDVRKPFSLLKIGLEMLRNARDASELMDLRARLVPEVERAMAAVEGMISDVMGISASQEPMRDVLSLESLLESAINEVFRLRPGAKVALSYQLAHKHKLNVDGLKTLRVLTNILDNAVHAMQQSGLVTFRTREVEKDAQRYVELQVHNTGSSVPPGDLPHLFEPFFTKDKRNGTGLGLAIAHKVVTEHGGEIWCESSEAGGTTFGLTLPLAVEVPNETTAMLPAHSREVTEAMHAQYPDYVPSPQDDAVAEHAAEQELLKIARGRGHKLRVLLVDDESIHLNFLEAQIMKRGTLKPAVQVFKATVGEVALGLMEEFDPDLIVCDIDLGPSSLSGYEIVEAARARHLKNRICMHTNRNTPAARQRAKEVGAADFWPKPIGRAALLRLIQEAGIGKYLCDVADAGEETAAIAVVDDDVFVLEAWERLFTGLTGITLATYDSPEAFWRHIAEGANLEGLRCVITDYYFGDKSDLDGVAFAKAVKARANVPVLLSSDAHEVDFEGAIDAQIGKEPTPWMRLSAVIAGTAVVSG